MVATISLSNTPARKAPVPRLVGATGTRRKGLAIARAIGKLFAELNACRVQALATIAGVSRPAFEVAA